MNLRARFSLLFASAFPLAAIGAGADEPAKFPPEHLEFFEKRIRPVLVEKCHRCHSHESEKLKGDLYLDSRAGLIQGGGLGAAAEPGKPAESLLLESIKYESPELQMPPKAKLEDSVIADFEKWIALGMPWPEESGAKAAVKADFSEELERRKAEHWSWHPIQKPAVPEPEKADWAESEVDRFLLARLEKEGLLPAEDAAPEAWLRRVHFDLVGLPPSPDEVRGFLAATQADAAAARRAVVDRLLASPHFGERWARHWMDLARFAETCGHEFDFPIPEAWRYRDYLIRAYNEDLPYDRFLTEHLAGDLMNKPRRLADTGTNESILATGFWFLHEAVHAPTDVKQDEADRIDNQLDVFGKAFLGLGLGCVRCHDHKFDAISAADYYALSGYLQSSRRQEAPLDPGGRVKAAADKARELAARGDALLGQAFGEKTGASGTEFAAYLLAADELSRRPEVRLSETNPGDVLLADFESGYGGWEIKGEAFGKAPAKGGFPNQQPVTGYAGKFLVNSYRSNDNLTGTLTSPEFGISRKHLRFLVGGGRFPETSVKLLVEGKEVLSVSGKNEEKLVPVTWDVSDWRGKKARVQIVDQRKGSWGHINADHFLLSDRAEEGKDGDKSRLHPVPPDLIEAEAKTRGLDRDRLLRWVEVLRDLPEAESAGHPLHAWVKTAHHAAAGQEMAKRLGEAREQHEAALAQAARRYRFDGGAGEGWRTTGEAFGAAPLAKAAWAGGSGPRLVAPGGVWSSLRAGTRQEGVLTSPTFTLDGPHVHLRVRARNVEIRVVIDGYYMHRYQQLLFGGTLLKPDQVDTGEEFKWLTLSGNLDKYAGHKVWLEIRDPGDGGIELDEVAVSNSPLPPDRGGAVALRVLGNGAHGAESLAASYGTLWEEARAGLAKGGVDEAGGALLDFVWSRGLWPGGPAAAGLRELGAEFANADEATPAQTYATALQEGDPEDEPVHLRGSAKKPGETVARRNLTAFGGQATPRGHSGRLELAADLTAEGNPLVARVMVNRLWHHLFGQGLVPTVDDFGAMGLPPSHPELLDWLAADFRERGWSVKSTLRELVLSRAYRQSTVANPGNDPARLAVADPGNVLLHRAPVKRLDGESIRDSLLAISGRLKPDLGGQSVPVHLTAFMEGRGRPGRVGPLDGEGRRSLYLEIRRNFLAPFLLAFDTPIPFNAMGRRAESNVPAQSLMLMNDPLVQELARSWSERSASAHPQDVGARLRSLFMEAFGRSATAEEIRRSREFLTLSGGEADARAWADLCHALVNKKEFIFLN